MGCIGLSPVTENEKNMENKLNWINKTPMRGCEGRGGYIVRGTGLLAQP